ncbi:hypothetical protein DFJ73DRAFT_847964 [Zopfochytrium polystomum]|nr:hypothetical protein DFJ73DRAFT_847964 [Zopfochytrium polystomum]
MRDDPRRCASPSAVNYSSSSVGSPRKAGGGVQPPPPAAEDDGSDDAGNAGEPPKRGFRALTREFGPIALGVYLCVTSVFFVGCLTSIYVIGIDRDSILAVLKRAKALVGLSDKKKDAEEAAEEAENKKHIKEGARSFMDVLPDWLKTPAVQTLATNVLLAMAMTKLFLPIKLTIVAFLTPTVARRLRSMGFDFGTRGYREMARDASGRVKERLKKNQ